MTFTLTKKSVGSLLTTFHVLDSQSNIVGSVNVKNAEVPDLIRCWQGQTDRPSQQQPQSGALAKAFSKIGPISRAAILRGCWNGLEWQVRRLSNGETCPLS
jgi:hypothetical protein